MTEKHTHLTVNDQNGVTVVSFADRKILDELCIAEIRDELTDLVNNNNGVKMLLTFNNVDHLSSAALGVLISLNKQVKEKNGELILSDITPQIFEVFKITRLNKLFEICDTAEEALGKFS